MVQIFIAGAVAFLVAIFVTPLLIRYFNRRAMGQEIREDGPKSHARKRGTPTMGGIAILLAITLGYVASGLWSMFTGHRVFSATGLIVLGLTLALGAVGFADDGMKLFFKRNLGLNKTAKLVAQLGIALAFGLLVLQFPDENGQTPASTNLSFVRDMNTINFAAVGGVVGVIMFLVFIYFLLAAWSNAVNLTDGLDGLAAGTTSLVMAAYTGVTFWQFRNSCSAAPGPGCYDVRDPLDLAVLAAAGFGACMGFLWWNASPAKIFMGDTGSLALGGLVAGLSVTSKTELLMVIIGSVFVMEAASVVIQVVSFKATGKRVFRMAPFHHHFENGGWAEQTVVIRFWLIAAMSVATGLALFYGEWLTKVGVTMP
ncbi:phospho-N-acetylmuramoyl-pentapeptide-transferase [Corynebacterium sanguinis]|uniref:Phospho-N-acetylmuramoyl-pentapeptide-transferase n=1 Tax=Corynebacterium sanguinis TaxID=2594913 RepID=A0A838X1N3_9CORY|nr:phospho-N-acetylmuramoyl-pentapeptide-transferase [Corynebacterium sanguinis]MBA4504607.1 phospho-N-acetylmuramoyl-pentapeptide-transferase [Corynebacterium sanguinis]MCT1411882.1 phospho-N-acetylmuramoyl-pentapeptide-transferase [Corynebacterium sanguinis]MCT1424874.1 phospho-N-acetylmuramoyl-pentapeptide-transferase [Corynebacterium sanguinis]MCT1443793.1 phospho-N-acetylmuramoyl-pentapeptide-transferase [Corynebacterium sanguinis]MCT1491436.1 phospho-N-acetylmuramoyl-pentapeptide-transfe